MKILGLDPGTKRIGYGLIKKRKKQTHFLEAGLLSLESSKKSVLPEIEKSLKKLLKKTEPELVVLEKLFIVRNQKTGAAVNEAIGVIKLVCLKKKIRFIEVHPTEVKCFLTGYGQASKELVIEKVACFLKLKIKYKTDDAYDGLAIALTGARNDQRQ